MKTLGYEDDPTAQELFELAGKALANPGDAEPRRAFWLFVEDRSDHPWIGALTRMAAASHPHGLDAGNKKLRTAFEDANGLPYAGQPSWLRGVYLAFGL